MLKRIAIVALLSLPALAQADGPSRAKIGEKIPDLAFRDDKGTRHSLHDLVDKKAIVLVFLSFECPVSNSYCRALADMDREFGKYGVAFRGFTVNEDDSPVAIAKQARSFNLDFPVFLDKNLALARAVEADTTPEVFVLDGGFTLRYRGRIDNGFSERLKHQPVTRQDLRQVLGELLSGRPVAEPATQALGCPITREERKPTRTSNFTYHKDVEPILQKHCQSCHRPGEVGPFSLMTYRQAVNWADDLKTFTAKRIMPPWKPTDDSMKFHDDRRMTDAEIALLADWADGGTPRGDPKDAPPQRKFTEGWQLGVPDLILSPGEEFVLGPTGKDLYRCFVLPTNLPEDVHINAMELRPGNPRVVHHLLLFIDNFGQARKLEELERTRKPEPPVVDAWHPQAVASPDWDKGPGYTTAMGVGFLPQGNLMGWAPGMMPRRLPDDSGFLLPKKADVVMQIHYHRDGRVARDRTQIGLYFSKKKVDRPFAGGVVAGGKGTGAFRTFFSIPPGESGFTLNGDAYAHGDFTLHIVTPHMHLLGKEIKCTITPPGEPTRTIIHIKDWDYNWQENYILKEPLRIKAGTKLSVEAVYDNSEKNLLNPFSPPRRITFGEQTFNEMCLVFLGGTTSRDTWMGRNRLLPLLPKSP